MSEIGDVSRGLWQWEFSSQDFRYRDLPPVDEATQLENTLAYIKNRYANAYGFMTLQSYAGPVEDESHGDSQGQGDDDSVR